MFARLFCSPFTDRPLTSPTFELSAYKGRGANPEGKLLDNENFDQ
jgi:hypothetical protein